METTYKGDILETALNSGIAFTAQKYNIDKADVYSIVKKFQGEITINEPCSCDKLRAQGCWVDCFMCDNGSGRINI